MKEMLTTIKELLEILVSTAAIAILLLLCTVFFGILGAICVAIWICAIPIASFALALDMQSTKDGKEKK